MLCPSGPVTNSRNRAVAVKLAWQPEHIRGFGHVKAASVQAAREQRAQLLEQLRGHQPARRSDSSSRRLTAACAVSLGVPPRARKDRAFESGQAAYCTRSNTQTVVNWAGSQLGSL